MGREKIKKKTCHQQTVNLKGRLLWASVLMDLTKSINKMKKIGVFLVLSFLINLQSFAQSGVDFNASFISTQH